MDEKFHFQLVCTNSKIKKNDAILSVHLFQLPNGNWIRSRRFQVGEWQLTNKLSIFEKDNPDSAPEEFERWQDCLSSTINRLSHFYGEIEYIRIDSNKKIRVWFVYEPGIFQKIRKSMVVFGENCYPNLPAKVVCLDDIQVTVKVDPGSVTAIEHYVGNRSTRQIRQIGKWNYYL